MTHCRKYREMIIDALYGDLNRQGTAVLENHLAQCAACSLEYERTSDALRTVERRSRPVLQEPYWDEYWQKLETKIDALPQAPVDEKSGPRVVILRRFLYPAAALLVMGLGIWIGKLFYAPPPGGAASNNDNAAVAMSVEHFDNLRPLLVECANYQPGDKDPADGPTVTIPKKMLDNLLFRHHLLKRAAAVRNDKELRELVDELELILIDIANAGEQPGQSLDRVRQVLKDRDILFKMAVYENKQKKRIRI